MESGCKLNWYAHHYPLPLVVCLTPLRVGWGGGGGALIPHHGKCAVVKF